MNRWVEVNGYALVTVGAGEWTGVEKDWIVNGTTMYWSHTDSSFNELEFDRVN